MKQNNILLKMAVVMVMAMAVGFSAQAQNEAVSPVGIVNIVKEVKPPIFQIQGKSILVEPSGNNAIDAGEQCTLRMTVKNTGMGDGFGLKARICTKNTVPGVTFSDVTMPTLKVGDTYTIEYPITASMNTTDGTAEFLLSIEEPNGFNLQDVSVKVPTRAFLAPMVEFRGHIIENGAVTLARNTPYTMQVLVQNTGRGKAERVNVSLVLPEGVYQLGEVDGLHESNLASGQSHTIKFSFIIPQVYTQSKLPVIVRISERYGKYGKDEQITFDVRDQQQEDFVIVEKKDTLQGVTLASLGSDVDRDIPRATTTNNTLHVMIIANQGYTDEKPVSTALSDGRMMKEYCHSTLGLPEDNVRLYVNRTGTQMRTNVEEFCDWIDANKGHKFYFFYYGHGMHSHNPKIEDAYLIPVDGTSLRLEKTGVSRNWMMQQFEKANPDQLVVCLESCFSGATESDSLLAYSEKTSGIRLVDDVKNTFKGNIVLITASSEAQTANAYPSQRHNVFTYEMLKALKDNKGNVAWGDFFEAVQENTKQTAQNKLKRKQVPSITISSTLGDAWKTWSVK